MYIDKATILHQAFFSKNLFKFVKQGGLEKEFKLAPLSHYLINNYRPQ